MNVYSLNFLKRKLFSVLNASCSFLPQVTVPPQGILN